MLTEREIPLILTSSKTMAEMRHVREDLGNDAPFIFENGAGAALPQGVFPTAGELFGGDRLRVKLFGADRGRILDVLRKRREGGDRFEGFSDWTAEEVAAVTGLDRAAAARAQDRLATEPLLWRDAVEKQAAFAEALDDEGVRLVQGGRFWCAMGKFDKADAARWLTSLYRQAEPESEIATVALGDSPNDVGMLSEADVAVVIQSANSDQMRLEGHPRVIRTNRPGPEGWAEAISTLLPEYFPH